MVHEEMILHAHEGYLPQSWNVMPASEVCTKVTDGTHDTPTPTDVGVPFITAIHIKNGTIDFSSCKYLSQETHNDIYKRCNPEKGDLLIVNIGAGVSECGYVDVDYEFSLKNVALLKPNSKKLDSKYLFHHHQYKKDRIAHRVKSGGAQPFLSLKELRKLNIVVPPLAEQRKIATILGTWDKAINATERLIDNSKQQKKALMQQLLTGKKRLLDDSGKPFEGQWEEVIFGDCIEHTGGTALEKHVIDDAQHHFISIGNYSMDGKYIDKGQRIELNSKTKTKLLNKNDLVMVLNDKTKTGDIIGSTILIDEDNKYIYNQRSERIVPNKEINVSFFWYLLNSFQIRTEVFSRSQGGTQIYVNFGALKSIALNVPKQEEQKRIATVLTNAYKEIELLEQQLADLKQEKKALMQQLLTGKRRVKVESQECIA